jgi:hypothetical protein
MSFLAPKAPAPPPVPPAPPAPPTPASTSIIETGATQRAAVTGADGAGFEGNDVTGGQGAPSPSTTANPQKSLLGG